MKKDIVKIGVIGCGAIANQYHMPALKSLPDCEVVAVCDWIPERAKAAADYFGLPQNRAFTEDEALLALDEIQGVLILTPNYNHCEVTELAASWKKHVFVTKPMGRTLDECRRMMKACQDNGVQLFVSFMHRYLLGIAETRRLVQENAIGKIEMVRILNAPGATSTVSKWFYDEKNVGGGCVIDLGVHGIDLVRYLIGEIDEVTFADMGRFRDTIFTDGEYVHPNNEDHAIAIYKTRSGATVNHMISWHHWSNADRFSMELFGEKGSIFLRDPMGIVNVCKVEPGKPATWVSLQLPYEKLGVEQHECFLEMIRTNGTANPGGTDGLACIRVDRAIYQAITTGIPDQLDCLERL